MTPSSYDTSSGDDYPYYRGIRLQFLPGNRMYWRSPREEGLHINVKTGHKEIARKLLKIRPEGGSCRITETGEVLVKIADDDDPVPVIPRYVCQLRKSLVFDGDIDNRPTGLEPGSLWTGIYDGTRLAFLPTSDGEQKVWWSTVEDFSVRYAVQTKIPRELLRHLNMWKPLGGRFCVTPDGYVLTLIEKGLLRQSDKQRYKELYENERYDPLRLIDIKESRTGLFPVFIGIWDLDSPPSFKSPRKWGSDLDDDERERVLKNISSFLGGDSVGMVNPESKIDEPEDDPDLIRDWGDYIPDAEDSEVALLMEEE